MNDCKVKDLIFSDEHNFTHHYPILIIIYDTNISFY